MAARVVCCSAAGMPTPPPPPHTSPRTPPRTLDCGGKLKGWAVSCVAVGRVSAHMENVGRGGSEAGDHHAGGSGPRRRVAQLLLVLRAQIAGGNEHRRKCVISASRQRLCISPLLQPHFGNKRTHHFQVINKQSRC